MDTLKETIKARPSTSTTADATARANSKFNAARRTAVRTAATSVQSGKVVDSLRDSAPGVVLIGWAIAEAVFVEPIRTIRRKFRGSSKVA